MYWMLAVYTAADGSAFCYFLRLLQIIYISGKYYTLIIYRFNNQNICTDFDDLCFTKEDNDQQQAIILYQHPPGS
jgi:hypothetical protein